VESFEIKGTAYTVEKAKFKLWIELEEIQNHIIQAVEHKDANKISRYLCQYVSTACSIPMEELTDAPWLEIARAYVSVMLENTIGIRLPFAQYEIDKEEVSWEYEGRTWYTYAHRIAREFGWSLEYIGELEVDDAFALMQEMMIENQLHKEWEWSLSDRSYGKDKNSGQWRHFPLPRPPWMEDKPKEPEKILIPKSLLPVGNVISYRGENVIH
jgi:hypothetical protein